MLRVLQVITDTDRRGAQVFAGDLGDALVARGVEVRLVALAAGASAQRMQVPHLGRSRLAFGTLRALRSELSRSDVVIGHGSSTLFACAGAGLGVATPFVYRQISDSLFWAPTAARRLRVRLAMRQATAIVSLWAGASRTLEDRFGVDPRKLTVIPNGVPGGEFDVAPGSGRRELGERLGLPPDVAVILSVGALVPEKGIDTVIRAVELLPGAHLVVVGSGPRRLELEALARRHCPGRAHFVGSQSALAEFYAGADVVVLASRGGDSMPAVLIEAALCQVPSVATPVEAVPEVVIDGVTGCLVPPDDPPALAAGIAQALARKASYGVAARQHCVSRFEIGVVADAWLRLLRRVCE